MSELAVCPICNNKFETLTQEIILENEGCTVEHTAGNCGSLLIIKNGVLVDFHKYMNKQNPQWPADGKNTGCIEV